MEFKNTIFEGLYIIQPRIFPDERGYFFESFNQSLFEANNIKTQFLQDNQSASKKNVLRGLHFQLPPFSQAKLVRVIKGAVLDVVVDLRKNASTFGKHFSIELTESNHTMMYIPEGFAHGFVSLEDNTIFSYKCSALYNKQSECCIRWDDPDLQINWGIEKPIVSEKDMQGILFSAFNSPFL